MKSLIIFIALFLCQSFSVFATADYLCANTITNELYWADDDRPPGWIGWNVLPENFELLESQLIKNGYSYTSFPYKIEVTIFVFFMSVYICIRNRKKW